MPLGILGTLCKPHICNGQNSMGDVISGPPHPSWDAGSILGSQIFKLIDGTQN